MQGGLKYWLASCIQELQVQLVDKSWSQDDEPSESSNDTSTRDFSDLSDEDHTDF